MNPLLSPNQFPCGHLIEIEWLVTDITAVGASDRGERAILGMNLVIVWPIQAIFVVGEAFCDVGTPP